MSAAVIELAAVCRRNRRVDLCHDRAAASILRRDDWRTGAARLRNPVASDRWAAWADMEAWRAMAWSMAAQVQMELSRGDREAAQRAARQARRAWRMAQTTKKFAMEVI